MIVLLNTALSRIRESDGCVKANHGEGTGIEALWVSIMVVSQTPALRAMSSRTTGIVLQSLGKIARIIGSRARAGVTPAGTSEFWEDPTSRSVLATGVTSTMLRLTVSPSLVTKLISLAGVEGVMLGEKDLALADKRTAPVAWITRRLNRFPRRNAREIEIRRPRIGIPREALTVCLVHR